jgi:hypothetical protein
MPRKRLDPTIRHFDIGDWVSYRFCGGVGYAYINAYEWYVPRNTGRSPQVVYLCAKLFGVNSSYGLYFRNYAHQIGWKDQQDFYIRHPEFRRKNWPEGKQPDYKYLTSRFMKVYTSDIFGKVSFDNQTLTEIRSHWNHNTQTYEEYETQQPNKFYYFDREKLEAEASVANSDIAWQKAFQQERCERFNTRKAEVLLRKLEQ